MHGTPAASHVIGWLAYIEIPCQTWQDLISTLLGNMAQQSASPTLKQATLEALEYVFEEFLTFKQDEIDDVLDAVVRAMNPAEQSSVVRCAAVKALRNVLKFADFANEDCRTRILTAICDAAKSDEAEMVKHAAFSCLIAIAHINYIMLKPYMETTLSLTIEALEGGAETVALQCIEFWNTISEEVIKPREWKKCLPHANSTADCCFIEKTLCSVVPVLLETLLNQDGRDDAQNISMSAMACLGLIARTIGDAIVPLQCSLSRVTSKRQIGRVARQLLLR
jgi:importin subunit beta-1